MRVIKTGLGLVLAIALLAAAGCAATLKGKLQQADKSIYSVLAAIDQEEQTQFDSKVLCGTAPCISPAAHQKFSGYMVTALRAGKTFHLSVQAWKPGQAVPVDVQQVSDALKSAAETIKTMVPDSPQKNKIGLLLDTAALAVSQALLLILPPAQVEALMPAVLFAH